MNKKITEILSLISDKRMGVGFASNPVPQWQSWLEDKFVYFKNNQFEKVKKDVEQILQYSKKLKDPGNLKFALDLEKNAKIYYAETYVFHQQYFFYNEVINYGYFQQYLIDKIKKYNLNFDETVNNLTKSVKSKAYLDYNGLKEHNKKITDGIPAEIVELYSLLLYLQDLLYNINENLTKVYTTIREKYNLDKKYPQKAVLFNIYLKTVDYSRFRMQDKTVFFDKYIFKIDTGQVYELSNDLIATLNILLKRQHFMKPAVLVLNDIMQLIKLNFITTKNFDQKVRYYRIFYELTNKCNLNCRYCFNRSMARSFELQTRDWEYISDYLPKNSQINLFGGEPFEYGGIEAVLLKLDTLLSKKKIREVRCFTNGTNTEKIISILKKIKNPLWILISLDGIEQDNDKSRGKGNYNKTIETIKKIKKETKHIIWVKSLITNLNYKNIASFVKILDGIGVDYFSLGELQIEGNAKGKETELLSFENEFPLIGVVKSKTKHLKIKDENILEDFLINRCGYGHCLIYIRSDGFIGGCTENDTSLRHIFEAYPNMLEFKKDPISFVPDCFKIGMTTIESKCFSCPYVQLCMGGCYARALRNKTTCDILRKNKVEYLLNLLKNNFLNNS